MMSWPQTGPTAVGSQSSEMGHIWMIGMMGTGKTTVGALVAEHLSRPFSDLDTEIMVHTGRTIPELFQAGEERFREMESMVLARLAEGDPGVVSTGGGAVLRSSNVEIMERTGTVVLLTASVDEITDRLGDGDGRPLANGASSLADLSTRRLESYENAAHFTVSTDGKSPQAVAQEVVACGAT
jgi:shikimate kinase